MQSSVLLQCGAMEAEAETVAEDCGDETKEDGP
jgi:hypothetical protein